MTGLAEWFLSVTLWAGGPIMVEGPYTEAACMACGEEWLQRSEEFVRQNRRLYPGFPRFSGRSWGCFQHLPTDPAVKVSFPNQPKLCEAEQ